MTDPKPGSPDAINSGCTCPVIDNHHGRGDPRGWWVSGDCPLHGMQLREKESAP
jgi:hypothetical protein